MFEITFVRVYENLSINNDKVLALVDIVLDDCFAIHGLKVIQGNHGLFVSMPSRKLHNGKYQDVVHPINSSTRQYIEDVILSEFDIYQENLLDNRSNRGDY